MTAYNSSIIIIIPVGVYSWSISLRYQNVSYIIVHSNSFHLSHAYTPVIPIQRQRNNFNIKQILLVQLQLLTTLENVALAYLTRPIMLMLQSRRNKATTGMQLLEFYHRI